MANFDFFATSELLKRTKRKGWVIRGVDDPESVADHMFQMSLICLAYPWVRQTPSPPPPKACDDRGLMSL